MTLPHTHSCRFCDAPLTHVFLDLGSTPLANSYVSDADLTQGEPSYPLLVHVCDACLLVQAQPVVPAEEIFSDYAYFSSYSTLWLEHAAHYSQMITKRLQLDRSHFVVEIASNDGYLLQHFLKTGIPCLGVEPAANVAKAAIAKQVPTHVAFFGEETANTLRSTHPPADLIIANNVLAHVPDLNDFVRGFAVLLAEGGTITVEFPHVLQLIQQVQFDTIYHEHYSYFSLYTLEKVFAHHGLTIFDVESLPTHGGSLRIYACHQSDARSSQPSASMREVRAEETRAELHNLHGYQHMQDAVARVSSELVAFLQQAKRNHRSVAAYGAAAKGNTLLNVCGVTRELIDFVVDKNPHKQGRYLPGSHIPILAPDALAISKPDYVLILPWNIEEEIRREWESIASWGGQFVTAIPSLKVWG